MDTKWLRLASLLEQCGMSRPGALQAAQAQAVSAPRDRERLRALLAPLATGATVTPGPAGVRIVSASGVVMELADH